MASSKKKTASGKKDAPVPKKKAPKLKLPIVITEPAEDMPEKLTLEKIERMMEDEIRTAYKEFFGENIPEPILKEVMKIEPTHEELIEIDRIMEMTSVISRHIDHINNEDAPYPTEKEVLAVVSLLKPSVVEILAKELYLIGEKSPYESVRMAAEKKLNLMGYD